MPIDSSTSQQEPAREYNRWLDELRASEAGLKRRDATLGYAKLAILLLGLIAVFWLLASRSVAVYWVLLLAFPFVYLMVAHERVIGRLKRCSRAIAFYERGLARLGNTWAGKGEAGERFADASHPYSRDLDLFGKGSLFELLCDARTRAGEDTLASWLLAPSGPEEIRARNAAIEDLRSRLDLREDLAALGEHVRAGVRPDALVAWAEGQPALGSRAGRIAAFVLSIVWLASVIGWAVWDLRTFAVLSTIVNLSFAARFRVRLREIVALAEKAGQDLSLLADVLGRLEREKFSAAKLVELQTQLAAQGVAPSHSIARLGRLVELLISRRNPILQVMDPFVLWSLNLAFAIEAWRQRFGGAVRGWLAAVGEMEALSSLAAYAYEHPADVFPEFTGDAPCFDAEGFAHPLIPEERAVRNDLRLDRDFRLMIISGPNMAGKSTFVRSVGINAVLAQCGAPVRARRLRLSRLAVAASVCILDSLQGGISRFYAEIARLKLITDLTNGPSPVLFLLDELLSGTNSHDRRIGAEAMARNLFERGAIGLITTHDLALAEIADSLGPGAGNFHFEDRLENGKLRFDYRLSPGIVRTSNALDLMRSIGLDV
ncbi:MAG: MutS-related protein [Candidatus Acidiferrales bacterium]